jgi:mRNA interferase RelE/StbE
VYTVQFRPAAEREFRKLPKVIRRQLAAKIDALAEDPRPSDVAKITGTEYWRVRVRDYRIVYTIEDEELIVLVVKIADRKEVYRFLQR